MGSNILDLFRSRYHNHASVTCLKSSKHSVHYPNSPVSYRPYYFGFKKKRVTRQIELQAYNDLTLAGLEELDYVTISNL